MPEEKCKHESAYYFCCPNEDGWQCERCSKKMPGEPPGYRPDLDRSDTGTKVGGILNDLHENKFIYISNGSMGDALTADVVTKCHETGLFDQYSIAQFIFQLLTPDHADYWKKIGEGVVNKRDIRDRCWCGKLAQQSGKQWPGVFFQARR